MTTARVNEHCMGLAACVAFAPDLFRLVDGQAVVTTPGPLSAEQVELVEKASDGCPMQAIDVS